MTVQPGLPGFNIEAQSKMLEEFGTSPEEAGNKLSLIKERQHRVEYRKKLKTEWIPE